jgi:hypothetical protein
VRVVFLNTLTCYNMSIIVPSMARDQYQYLAQPDNVYRNVLSKTDELELVYMYQLADAAGGFDTLEARAIRNLFLHPLTCLIIVQ